MLGKMLTTLAAAAFLGSGSPVFAHGPETQGKKPAGKISIDEHAFGREGDPAKVSMTVQVDMADTMRFTPDSLVVKAGETVKFVVKNSGKQTHEMVIGTETELKAHAEFMRKHPTMEHDAPYMAHVGSGKKEEIVWQFTKPGEYHYGCLIPGHFEAGMKGKIVVVSK
jgi:uncharacterized cupredoxin-like copper-binding protein